MSSVFVAAPSFLRKEKSEFPEIVRGEMSA